MGLVSRFSCHGNVFVYVTDSTKVIMSELSGGLVESEPLDEAGWAVVKSGMPSVQPWNRL